MSEAAAGPRRSARNAAKPPAQAPTPNTKAAPKRKSNPEEEEESKDKDEKKVKSNPAADVAEKPTKTTTSSSAGGTLKVGDKLPSFKLKLQNGEEIDTSSLKNAVLFSYPRANTGGCTTQAKLYRDHHSSFTSSGYTVFGLSNDSPTSLSSWKTKQSFPYDLISDPKRQIIKSLTGSDDKTKRSHFVIDAEGRLAFVRLSVKPAESWQSALEFVEKQQKK